MTTPTPISDDVLSSPLHDAAEDVVATVTGEVTEHVIEPTRTPRVFTADTSNELDDIATEAAPDTLATIDEKPVPAPPAAAAVAVREQAGPLAVAEQDWPHDFMDFEGDRLAVRLPDERALTGFALSVGKYIPAETQNDMVSLFMNRHMSPDSYGHVMARMMDPDDASYTTKTVGQLFNAIVKAAGEVRAEEAKAKAVDAAKPK